MIDLHIHSTCSDGMLSPHKIIDEAKNNGILTISITDHDSVNAYTKETIDYAKQQGINLIIGVELSTSALGVGFHVLGYNFEINDEIKDLLYVANNARHIYLDKVSKRLRELGYVVNVDKLSQIKSVAKSHIANDIINNALNSEILINNFGHIPTMGEFIETIMNEGCPAFIEKPCITPNKAGEVIHKAGGKVVLAHPVANVIEDDIHLDKIIDLAKEMQADGLETYYHYYTKHGEKVDKCMEYTKIAKDNGFFVTVGSDFHNYHDALPNIGFTNTDLKLSSEEGKQIIESIKGIKK